jgi:hypothetical protein
VVASGGEAGHFSTVATWRGPYGPVEYGGRSYGQKLHEFRRFVELPARTGYHFELALDVHPAERADLDLLDRNGWHRVDPQAVAFDPPAYRRYLQAAGAEFSAAQGVYVQTGSGWFSDRTACYLASGKPALVQDTGFTRPRLGGSLALPAGDGLVAFRTLEEAVAGAHRVARDYAGHQQAARAIAETYFNSDTVLGRLIG